MDGPIDTAGRSGSPKGKYNPPSYYPTNAGFANGLFVMTTATDHKNNLNSSALKKNYARTLRVETIANSAGGTAEVAIVAQPSTGFLNTRFYPNGSPTEDTEDCLGRITVGLTRSKSLTLLVSPLDMMGPMGIAQVIATIAYGIQGLRRGETTWDWPNFNANPEQENLDQMRRWSLNTAPSWSDPPSQLPTNIMTTKPTSQRAYDIDSSWYGCQTLNG